MSSFAGHFLQNSPVISGWFAEIKWFTRQGILCVVVTLYGPLWWARIAPISTHIHTPTHTYTYTCTHTHTRTDQHARMHTHTNIYTHSHTRARMHTHAQMHNWQTGEEERDDVLCEWINREDALCEWINQVACLLADVFTCLSVVDLYV